MVATKSMIDEKIELLEKELVNVKGRETEQYARIVGYYRAIKNWNKGKKEEYKHRVNFTETTFNPKFNGSVEKDTPKVTVTKGKSKSTGEISSYKFFFRTTCPNCPPVKSIIKELELKGDSINADTTSGFTKAAIYEIFTAPTVVFLDKDEKEVKRASNPGELKKILAEYSIK